ncbi:MAG: helix-turn-helix transcriptional regulator [Spirochaetales bacterium]|jgi:transcriptional regulator with XRE-family HTH domain|nr:helix-turn-helix transcriptional regulator [Spirochaetales bacterium]
MTKSSIFQQRLVAARKLRDLNQEKLANRAGLQPAAVSHFETGVRKPSFDNLKKLAQALEVTTDYLLGKADDPEGFGDVNMAYRDELKGLTEEQRKITMSFIKILKSQHGKKG